MSQRTAVGTTESWGLVSACCSIVTAYIQPPGNLLIDDSVRYIWFTPGAAGKGTHPFVEMYIHVYILLLFSSLRFD